MKNFFSRLISDPFRRAIGLPWFGPTLSAVLLALMVNVLTDTLITLGGPLYGWLAVLVLFMAAILVIYAYHLQQKKIMRIIGPVGEGPAPQAEGMIFLLSNEAVLRKAIEHHLPDLKYCWLIHTKRTKDFAENDKEENPQITFFTKPVQNEFSAQETYELTWKIFNENKVEPGIPMEKMIADITGTTKPMTAGLVIACLEANCAMEHVPSHYDNLLKATIPLPPIEIQLQKH